MAQYENSLWKNSFILFCVIFRVQHLVQPGLMAGWLAGWPTDKIHVIFKIFKIHYRSKQE